MRHLLHRGRCDENGGTERPAEQVHSGVYLGDITENSRKKVDSGVGLPVLFKRHLIAGSAGIVVVGLWSDKEFHTRNVGELRGGGGGREGGGRRGKTKGER